MTGDEARKLLGGYATGSLTEAERRALLEAALENQDLFDQLAGEHMLKEVLDEPGARQRLMAALERRPQKDYSMWWAWAGGAVTLAMVIGVALYTRTPEPPQQIARALKSYEPVVAPTSANAPAPARPAAPAARQASPVAVSAPPPAEPQPAADQPATIARLAAPAPAAAAAAPEAREDLADRIQQAKPQVSEAVRGFVAGAPPAGLRAQNQLAQSAAGFGFNYAVRADGFLQIVPLSPGFLSVTANDAVAFPSGAVNAGMPVRVPVPPETTRLVVMFSLVAGAAGTPVHRDQLSGTVTDQDPPNGRIAIELSPTPATR